MIEKQLESLFRQEYDSGMTQWEIARKHNVRQQVISRLLSGHRKFGGLSVATVDKMFPQSILYFEGYSNVSIGDNNSVQIALRDNNSNVSASAVDDKFSCIVNLILNNSKLSIEEKNEHLRAIMRG